MGGHMLTWSWLWLHNCNEYDLLWMRNFSSLISINCSNELGGKPCLALWVYLHKVFLHQAILFKKSKKNPWFVPLNNFKSNVIFILSHICWAALLSNFGINVWCELFLGITVTVCCNFLGKHTMTTLNVQRVFDNHVTAYCVQSCISCL